MRCALAVLRRAASSSSSSEIGWLLSVSSQQAIHLRPGACAAVSSAPTSASARISRSLEEEVVCVEGEEGALDLVLPQRMETEIQGGSTVAIHAKLEGSCAVQAAGDIFVAGALRGAYVSLESTGGRVEAARVLEGVCSVRAHSGLRVARIMGERMALRCEGGELHVGAAFGDLTLEHAAGAAGPGAGGGAAAAVQLEGLHGSASIFSTRAAVSARGITGSLRVSGAPLSVLAQFDSARGRSSIVGVRGDVEVLVAPPLSLSLEVSAAGGLSVEPGEGGTFSGGTLVALGPPGAASAAASSGSGGGGSGKIREGGGISGWWSQGEDGGGGAPSSLRIECSGRARVVVQSYAEKLAANMGR